MWEAFAAIVTAAAGTLGLWLKLRHEKRQTAPDRAVRDAAAVYDLLNDVLYEVQALRVVVVKISNGGGVPNAKSPIYSTALYEVAEGVEPIRRLWQQQPVDESYLRCLAAVVDDGTVILQAEDLPAASTLGSIYGAAGVETVLKLFILRDPLAHYYLSVQWGDAEHDPTARQRVVLNNALPRLRRALQPD